MTDPVAADELLTGVNPSADVTSPLVSVTAPVRVLNDDTTDDAFAGVNPSAETIAPDVRLGAAADTTPLPSIDRPDPILMPPSVDAVAAGRVYAGPPPPSDAIADVLALVALASAEKFPSISAVVSGVPFAARRVIETVMGGPRIRNI